MDRRVRFTRRRLRIAGTIMVAFRSAKVACFRGAKGDYRTLIDRAFLTKVTPGLGQIINPPGSTSTCWSRASFFGGLTRPQYGENVHRVRRMRKSSHCRDADTGVKISPVGSSVNAREQQKRSPASTGEMTNQATYIIRALCTLSARGLGKPT